MILLRDPSHLSDQTVLVSPLALAAGELMDGRRTLAWIQSELGRRFGVAPSSEDLRVLVRRLDENLFLDSPRFAAWHARAVQEFRALPTRPAFMAGRSYPDEPGPLADLLEEFLVPAEPTPELRGLLAPHIDLERGGPVYGQTYGRLACAPPADLYVLFGTSHAPTRQPFVLTWKDYETPLGAVPTDTSLVDRLARRVGPRYFEDEFNHRAEHSLEFQALFLRHVLRDAPAFRVLPILCGVTPEMVRDGRSPDQVPAVRTFLEGLKEVLAETDGSVRYVGGVDLAHVGSQFGDDGPLTPEFLDWVEREDRRSLDHAIAGRAEEFWRSVTADGDRRRICGLAPIFAMLKVMPPSQGRLLDYQQCVDDEGTCCVSIAGVAYA